MVVEEVVVKGGVVAERAGAHTLGDWQPRASHPPQVRFIFQVFRAYTPLHRAKHQFFVQFLVNVIYLHQQSLSPVPTHILASVTSVPGRLHPSRDPPFQIPHPFLSMPPVRGGLIVVISRFLPIILGLPAVAQTFPRVSHSESPR